MPRSDFFDVILDVRGKGRVFAVATMVRTADVTSAKAGAKAAVTADGAVLGHLGGGCVTGAVRRAALAALEDGAVRVIRVKPAETVVAMRDADGAELHKSGCPSGGAVDVLIEPHVPPPLVAVLGETPVAEAIARQARLMGYRLAAGAVLAPDVALEEFDLGAAGVGARDFVIVAAQGGEIWRRSGRRWPRPRSTWRWWRAGERPRRWSSGCGRRGWRRGGSRG